MVNDALHEIALLKQREALQIINLDHGLPVKSLK